MCVYGCYLYISFWQNKILKLTRITLSCGSCDFVDNMVLKIIWPYKICVYNCSLNKSDIVAVIFSQVVVCSPTPFQLLILLSWSCSAVLSLGLLSYNWAQGTFYNACKISYKYFLCANEFLLMQAWDIFWHIESRVKFTLRAKGV